jgi:hypothetical protein
MTARTTDVLEHRIGTTGDLSIRIASGHIEVTGTDQDTATVRDLDGRDLSSRFSIETADGSLRLRQKEQILGLPLDRDRSVRLRVECPRRAGIGIETASADVEGSGFSASQRYRTASGEITLLDVEGTIRLDVVSGNVEMRLGGDTELEGRTVSGDVEIRGGRLSTLVLQTTSGDVDVRSDLPGPGPYSIKTVSGDANVVTGSSVRLESATVTGSVSTDLPHRRESAAGRTVLHVGSNGPALAFQSISGDMRLSAPGRDAVSPPERDTAATAPADERMSILRDLEAGRIDVAEATARLSLIEGNER